MSNPTQPDQIDAELRAAELLMPFIGTTFIGLEDDKRVLTIEDTTGLIRAIATECAKARIDEVDKLPPMFGPYKEQRIATREQQLLARVRREVPNKYERDAAQELRAGTYDNNEYQQSKGYDTAIDDIHAVLDRLEKEKADE